MHEEGRFKLHGTYRAPSHWVGRVVQDEIRGEVVITGTSKALIRWPVGRRERGTSVLVVFDGLAVALRSEAPRAVAHFWGVSSSTVNKWRKRLGLVRRPVASGREKP